MSKLTVITDTDGNIVAIGHGHLGESGAPGNGGPAAGLRAGRDQRLHEIEVEQPLDETSTWSDLHDAAQACISK